MKWDRTKGRPEPIRLLNLIEERENGEPLLDLREECPRVQILRETVIPYLRRTVCEMLHQASVSLPEGYFLGTIDAWRPFERQQRIYDFIWKCGKDAFPDRDENSLRRTVCRWVAPTNQKAPPGHCTGAAVDVFLVNLHGEEYDVHSPYGRFGAAPTYSLGLTEEAHKNRNILIEAMLGAGFSNCRDEWWHYSWGDAGWAVRTGETSCVYGLAKMDPASYAESEELHKIGFRDRPNPFLDPS
ncbi:MAG: M15 family metallopeptidase [Armatimonadota bacterium]